ncbi:MAG: hypothetical protein BWY44_00122 [Candidatus Omnitrophica bacterium ADurb.Bin292]|nr:MAG: hypothetical protein BWY44_00122 [Candidatus Omnitrophica bacterium ADurb.Bin292]
MGGKNDKPGIIKTNERHVHIVGRHEDLVRNSGILPNLPGIFQRGFIPVMPVRDVDPFRFHDLMNPGIYVRIRNRPQIMEDFLVIHSVKNRARIHGVLDDPANFMPRVPIKAEDRGKVCFDHAKKVHPVHFRAMKGLFVRNDDPVFKRLEPDPRQQRATIFGLPAQGVLERLPVNVKTGLFFPDKNVFCLPIKQTIPGAGIDIVLLVVRVLFFVQDKTNHIVGRPFTKTFLFFRGDHVIGRSNDIRDTDLLLVIAPRAKGLTIKKKS